jgi:2-polyprenyl-6-methoxyphenol hydroxylase-like FAD-dependent oxidoreductase
MTAGLEDAVALAQQLGGLASAAGQGPALPFAAVASAEGEGPPDLHAVAGGVEAALLRYNAERLPVVHRYQERSRQVSARTGRMRRPRVSSGSAPADTDHQTPTARAA